MMRLLRQHTALLKAIEAETISNESRSQEDGIKVPRVEIIDAK